MLVVRPETPADFGEIAAVVEAAFGESASAFARLHNLISIRRIRRSLNEAFMAVPLSAYDAAIRGRVLWPPALS